MINRFFRIKGYYIFGVEGLSLRKIANIVSIALTIYSIAEIFLRVVDKNSADRNPKNRSKRVIRADYKVKE